MELTEHTIDQIQSWAEYVSSMSDIEVGLQIGTSLGQQINLYSVIYGPEEAVECLREVANYMEDESRFALKKLEHAAFLDFLELKTVETPFG